MKYEFVNENCMEQDVNKAPSVLPDEYIPCIWRFGNFSLSTDIQPTVELQSKNLMDSNFPEKELYILIAAWQCEKTESVMEYPVDDVNARHRVWNPFEPLKVKLETCMVRLY